MFDHHVPTDWQSAGIAAKPGRGCAGPDDRPYSCRQRLTGKCLRTSSNGASGLIVARSVSARSARSCGAASQPNADAGVEQERSTE